MSNYEEGSEFFLEYRNGSTTTWNQWKSWTVSPAYVEVDKEIKRLKESGKIIAEIRWRVRHTSTTTTKISYP